MPKDFSPVGDEMASNMPEPKFPEPRRSRESDVPEQARPDARDISNRPALPGHPDPMAADIEDEESDPVIDSGPGIADGPKSLKKQRG